MVPQERLMMTLTIPRILTMFGLVAVLGGATARDARADWLLTPYLGVTFGGDATDQHVNYGLSAAFLGAGVFGFEVDASITPEFFESATADVEDSNVVTFMGNLMLSAPSTTPVRPYASAGAGLIRFRATSVGNVFDVDDSSFGVNLGGGLVAQPSDRVGIRGDIRYFRRIQDSDAGDDLDLDFSGFNFWRATLGVSFRF
jgi:opacity protein-like surface antigen